jgi:hypothetical protein
MAFGVRRDALVEELALRGFVVTTGTFAVALYRARRRARLRQEASGSRIQGGSPLARDPQEQGSVPPPNVVNATFTADLDPVPPVPI